MSLLPHATADELKLMNPQGPWCGPTYRCRGARVERSKGGHVCGLLMFDALPPLNWFMRVHRRYGEIVERPRIRRIETEQQKMLDDFRREFEELGRRIPPRLRPAHGADRAAPTGPSWRRADGRAPPRLSHASFSHNGAFGTAGGFRRARPPH
jgi:hypothetical protein